MITRSDKRKEKRGKRLVAIALNVFPEGTTDFDRAISPQFFNVYPTGDKNPCLIISSYGITTNKITVENSAFLEDAEKLARAYSLGDKMFGCIPRRCVIDRIYERRRQILKV